jgi:16S rRNA (guanine966-N2)-methyltransferase
LRVIAGKYRGQGLVSFKADHIRPTTDLVKGAIFNRMQDVIVGAQVLDLFCGTGSLGIEALSRGAESLTFVEKSSASLEILRKNLAKLKITEAYTILKKDVLAYLASAKDSQVKSFDVILIDPPFTEKMAHDVMLILGQTALFHEDTRIFIESGFKERIDDEYGCLILADRREYGDKTLSLFRKK